MSVTFSPSSWSPTQPGLSTATTSITVTNSGATKATVSLASGADPDFTLAPASSDVDPGATALVQVSYRPSKTKAATATLQAVKHGTTQSLASATLAGTPTNPLSIENTTDFGTVTLGAQAAAIVVMQNRADQDATLTVGTNAGASPAPFTFPGTYANLAGGGLAVGVLFSYAPTAVGKDAADATLTVGPWSVSVHLTGACVQPSDVAAGPISTKVTSDGTTTNYQSFYINVPNPSTTLNLGYKHAPTILVNGIGLNTTEYAYVNVGNDIGVIAGNNLNMQAQNDANCVTGNDWLAAAKGNAYLGGEQGVAIGSVDVSLTNDATTNMPDESGVKSTKTKLNAASAVFLAMDAFVGMATLYATTNNEVTRAKMFDRSAYGGWATGKKVFNVVASAASIMTGIIDTFGALQVGPGTPGVTIYGHAGVLLGTPGFASIYGGFGLMLGSIYPMMVGVETSVLSYKDLALTSLHGEANLSGHKTVVHGTEEVKLESNKEVSLHGYDSVKGKGDVKVEPKEITFASSNAADTEKSKIEMSHDRLDVGVQSTTSMKNSGFEVKLDSVVIDAGPKGKITLRAGGWEVTIGPDGVVVKKATGAAPSLELTSEKASLTNGTTASQLLVGTGASSLKCGAGTVRVMNTVVRAGPNFNGGG